MGRNPATTSRALHTGTRHSKEVQHSSTTTQQQQRRGVGRGGGGVCKTSSARTDRKSLVKYVDEKTLLLWTLKTPWGTNGPS